MASSFLQRTLTLGRTFVGLHSRPLILQRNYISKAGFFSGNRNAFSSLAQRPNILQFTRTKLWNATHLFTQRGSSPRGRGKGPGFIDSLPSGLIFWGILVINGVVFVAWQSAYSQYQVAGDSRWTRAMSDNFLASLRNFKEGRIWTVLTCCFSQSDTSHLLVNAFTYFFMARPVLIMLGNSQFLMLYLGGGIMASACSLLWSSLSRKDPNHASHGASGAIYAVVSFFACVSPHSIFLIFGVIPCPAWAFVTGVFIYDSLSAIGNKRMGTDTAGHVGGLLAGMGYFAARLFRIL